MNDPFGLNETEDRILKRKKIRSIREFDSIITAPRWGFSSVDSYYEQASPLQKVIKNKTLLDNLPPLLLIQSKDDPWVPVESFLNFKKIILEDLKIGKIKFLMTKRGGHNGFHSKNGCWGDSFISCWLSENFKR